MWCFDERGLCGMGFCSWWKEFGFGGDFLLFLFGVSQSTKIDRSSCWSIFGWKYHSREMKEVFFAQLYENVKDMNRRYIVKPSIFVISLLKWRRKTWDLFSILDLDISKKKKTICKKMKPLVDWMKQKASPKYVEFYPWTTLYTARRRFLW